MKIPLAAIAVVAALSPACVKVHGGAVEISWVVISPSGGGITDCSCADPAIAKVRLVLELVGGDGGAVMADGGAITTPCAGQAQCDFPCQNQTGATQFDIPPTGPGESYAVSVVAVGNDGLEIPQTEIMTPATPAPILLQVSNGQPTEVDAFTLVAPCSPACSGNVCAPQ
jgi:hypothetical protein